MSIVFNLYRNPNDGNSLRGDYPNGDFVAANLTVNAISQDQIDISWSASTGSGIEIQRSTTSGSGFSTVAFYDEEKTSTSLFSHEHSTTYYFRARYVSPTLTTDWSSEVSATTSAAVSEIYVATTGNDTTGDGSSGNPYATIQKAVHEATAGDVIQINAGTYTEAATDSLGNPRQYFTTDMGVYLENSGTPTNPIIIQAVPGDTVVISQAWGAGGFFIDSSNWVDHIHVKNIEVNRPLYSGYLCHDNASGDYTTPTSGNSRGLVMEGLRIIETADPSDQNVAGMRLDSTRDLTIRNCVIDGVYINGLVVGGDYGVNSACLLTYDQFGATVEFNEFSDAYNGWYVKDTAYGAPSFPTVNNSIRYNKFTNLDNGINFNAGAGSATTNETYTLIQSNIFRNVGVSVSLFGPKLENRVDVLHNFFDGGTGGPTNTALYGVASSSSASATEDKILNVNGNIFNNAVGYFNYYLPDTDNRTTVASADYNIFVNGPNGKIRSDALITVLATWQAVVDAQIVNPDTNSLASQVLSTLATNQAAADYTLPGGSPAIGLRNDGTNCGPYRYGSEIIGVVA